MPPKRAPLLILCPVTAAVIAPSPAPTIAEPTTAPIVAVVAAPIAAERPIAPAIAGAANGTATRASNEAAGLLDDLAEQSKYLKDLRSELDKASKGYQKKFFGLPDAPHRDKEFDTPNAPLLEVLEQK